MARPKHTSRQSRLLFAAMLSCADQWLYGYGIMQQTGLHSGTLYPLLARLADEGFLEQKWDEAPSNGRPARRLFRLSPAGAALAHERLSQSATQNTLHPGDI